MKIQWGPTNQPCIFPGCGGLRNDGSRLACEKHSDISSLSNGDKILIYSATIDHFEKDEFYPKLLLDTLKTRVEELRAEGNIQ